MKNILSKLNGGGVLKTVFSIAGVISTIGGLVTEHNKANDLEQMKKAISELQEKTKGL